MKEMVKEFHTKYGFPIDDELIVPRLGKSQAHLAFLMAFLKDFTEETEYYAILENQTGNPATYRIHLIAEEFGELIHAMLSGDEIGVADAMTDLLYVITGLGVTYGLPVDELFAEVHRSNMTKQTVTLDGNRGKGEEYDPPKIKEILDAFRNS
jgi:predicted HAD superfamily Cof-like phosphohydrolase